MLYKTYNLTNLNSWKLANMIPNLSENMEKFINLATDKIPFEITLKMCDHIYILMSIAFVTFVVGCILKSKWMKNNESDIVKKMEWHIFKSLTNKKATTMCKYLIVSHPHLINVLRNKKYTPFQLACYCGAEEIVLLMLKYGGNVFTRHYKNRTAFFLATRAVIKNKITNFEILKMLINSYAPINIPDSEGLTPLLLAALHGREDLVKWLLAHGADPSITWKNLPLWRLALQNGHEETAALLFMKNDNI